MPICPGINSEVMTRNFELKKLPLAGTLNLLGTQASTIGKRMGWDRNELGDSKLLNGSQYSVEFKAASLRIQQRNTR